MQYPIIDLITSAYINNGWTGLNVKPINIWDETWEIGGLSTTTGEIVVSFTSIRSADFIPCIPNTNYYLSCVTAATYIWFYRKDESYINFSTRTSNRVFTTPSDCYYMKIRSGDLSNPITVYNYDISINYPSTYHNYISQDDSINNDNDNKNDITHRLKLPLPHYFPHPVIDALERASIGTQTAEDTQILKHYLEPLGIGGI